MLKLFTKYKTVDTNSTIGDHLLCVADSWLYYDSFAKKLRSIHANEIDSKTGLFFFAITEDDVCIQKIHHAIERNGVKWGLATSKMQVIIPCRYETIESFMQNIYVCNDSVYFIRPHERETISFDYGRKNAHRIDSYEITILFSLSKITVGKIGDFCTVQSKGKLGTNQYIISPEGKVFDLGDNRKLISYNKQYMILSLDNVSISMDKKIAQTKMGVYRYLDFETPIIQHQYDFLEFINSNILVAYKNYRFGYIDIEENIIVPIELQDSEEYSIDKKSLSHGMLSVSKFDGFQFKYGFINVRGELVIPIEYDDYKGFYKDGTVKLLQGEQIVSFNTEGKVLGSKNRYFWDFETRIDDW